MAVIEGTVVMELTVLPSGDVEDAKRVSPVFYPPLDDLHEAYAKRWKFEERRSASVERIEFVYRFMPENTPTENLGILFVAPTKVEIRRIKPKPVSRR